MYRILRIACLALVLMWGFAANAAAVDIQSLGADPPAEESDPVTVWCTGYAYWFGDLDDPNAYSKVVDFYLSVEGWGPVAHHRYYLGPGQDVSDYIELVVPGASYDRTATCWAEGDLGNDFVQFQVAATQSQPSTPQPPDYETTQTTSWDTRTGFRTVHKFRMQLWGASNYAGKNVREANTLNGQVEWDTCYFSGSRIAYQNQVSGGWWPVQTTGTGAQGMWQYDYVGWSEDSVKYYRGQLSGGRNRTPCEARILQVMQIELTSGTWTTYQTNLLRIENRSLSSVGSSRDGVRTTRTF